MPTRRAVSRVEVIVVLLLILVLLGLVLSALGKVRIAADQARCKNNLKQFGFGIQNYYDSCGNLPLIAEQGEGSTGRGRPSFFASLVPFLESTSYGYPANQSAEKYHAHSSIQFT